MKKTVNGINVELVSRLGCARCIFFKKEGQIKVCTTEDITCLDSSDGGWRRVEEPKLLDEDPLFQ